MNWQNYTPMELGMGVHLSLLASRETKPRVEKDADILKAQEYSDALQEHINREAEVD